MVFLVLDKKDITNCVDVISVEELMEELKLTYKQVFNYVSNGHLYQDKYILVEDE